MCGGLGEVVFAEVVFDDGGTRGVEVGVEPGEGDAVDEAES